MSNVIRINDPAQVEPLPIILYLTPGEEKRIDLMVENHGDPTNLRITVGNHLYGALQLPEKDHYIVLDEMIPVMARIPRGINRLEGELLLKTDKESMTIPVTLLPATQDAEITEPKILDTSILDSNAVDSKIVDSDMVYIESRRRWRLFFPVIPIATVSLILTLLLTFSLRAIPEFPGALVSAILIVTLIIYGAATMLKT